MEKYSWIIQSIVTTVAGIIIPVVYTSMKRYIKKHTMKDDATQRGVMAILHDRLFAAHAYYMAQGYCPLNDKKNITYIYEPYAALGGNGTGKSAYEDIMGLPTAPEK